MENIKLEGFMSTMNNMLSGAGPGALAGSAILPGWGTAIGGLVGGIGGAIGGGLMGGNKETPMQGKQRELVDQLLASLKGSGPYSDMFNSNEATFNKSFRDPAMSMFKNQISPQIQQGYIASGQQRGTGMEDTLTRAGVDLDQLLNQQYAQYQQNAQGNRMNAMNTILSMGAGQPQLSAGERAMQGLGGYLSSDQFGKGMYNLGDVIARKGFGEERKVISPQYNQ